MSFSATLRHIGRIIPKIGGYLQSPVLLVIRLLVGIGFIVTGYGKLTHLDKITQYFASLSIPAPHLNAIMAGSSEFFCGILLAIGLLSRFAAIPLIITMCVAYATAESDSLKYLALNNNFSPGDFLGSTPYPFMSGAFVVLAFGPGIFSVDGLLKWFFLREKPAAAGKNA